MEQARIVLGLEEPSLQEAVLHFLDRFPRLSVVAAAGDEAGLAKALRNGRPDGVVLSPGLLAAGREIGDAALLVVAERETTGSLRSALSAGARGFYLWPEERESLGRDAERTGRAARPERERPARVVAVYGPRGGVGTTFVATNLSAACAARGAETVLVDFDVFFADVTTALGIVANGEARSAADLVPLAGELTAHQLEDVLHPHPRGFGVLLAPPGPEVAASVGPEHLSEAVRVLRSMSDVVLLHLPRAMSGLTIAGLQEADEILLVVTLDVLAFRDAKRALGFLKVRGLDGRCRLVVNRAARAEIVPEDAERVFGLRPLMVIGQDRSVPRAQNRGELLAGRSSRVARRIGSLAGLVLRGEGA